jgi:Mlc titration factor MtfA (ptsG expression regulator)
MDAAAPAVWPILVLVAAAIGIVVALFAHPRWVAWRHARLREQVFPAAWRRILRRRVPLVARMPPPLQWRLKAHIQVLLAEKPFIGCRGLHVTEEMRVTVAAQAALLLLGQARPGYFPGLRQILLYPGPFVVQRIEPQGGGVLHEQRQVLSGESWQQGQVILSWDDVIAGAADPADGHNVVLHEFAHQLDQETGAANGAPALRDAAQAARWPQVMRAAFAALQEQAAQGRPGVLNPYGASSEAEFFAVATEVFFEQPAALAAEQPALYAELARYYGVSPLAW